eukprot:TRINITY_DN36141_c0_g1_i2.p1 TRINITY_DN36141_c0_g1~~TRINITY_DN36141_c0_g1_i2.p1  ORF type:complete len:161 (-),score=34.64 TRINITY_DN36141_c0_g1_i2:207-689(-)
MIRRPPRSTLSSSSAASDVYKRQITSSAEMDGVCGGVVMSMREELAQALSQQGIEPPSFLEPLVVEDDDQGLGDSAVDGTLDTGGVFDDPGLTLAECAKLADLGRPGQDLPPSMSEMPKRSDSEVRLAVNSRKHGADTDSVVPASKRHRSNEFFASTDHD